MPFMLVLSEAELLLTLLTGCIPSPGPPPPKSPLPPNLPPPIMPHDSEDSRDAFTLPPPASMSKLPDAICMYEPALMPSPCASISKVPLEMYTNPRLSSSLFSACIPSFPE